MTYIKISSGSSGYTGKVFSLQTTTNPNDYRNWYTQLSSQFNNCFRYLNNQYFDPAYEISTFSSLVYTYYRIQLPPNKKILVQYQYLPKVLDTVTNAWVDISFCFGTNPQSSTIASKTSGSHGFVDATVHYKNVIRAGYDNYSYAAIGETIISHSESGNKLIGVHFKSTSDQQNSISSATTNRTTDTGHTWFKFTELD